MENININIIALEKSFEQQIMDDIEKNNLLTNFNTNIKQVLTNFENQLTKQKIYLNFIYKYQKSKNLFYILKFQPKLCEISNKKLNHYYIYCLFYIYLNFELFIKSYKDNKSIYTFNSYIRIIKFFYKNGLISWQEIINIFRYLLYQIKSRDKELQTNQKINIISNYLKYFGKIIKDLNSTINQKEKEDINKEIKNNIFEDLFEILSNNKNNGNYLYLMRLLIKEESMFILIKLIAKSDFFSEENKKYIEENVIKLLKNNFRKEHLNYFYKIFNKILIKFNDFNPNLKSKENKSNSSTCECSLYQKYFNDINKDFEFLIKINEILIKVIKDEKEQLRNSKCYYCDKGFVFNLKEKEKTGFKIKDIIYTKKKNNNFCILFSFQLRESNYNNANKIIFSICDSDKNEKITLYENGKNIYLRFFIKKMKEVKLKKVEYNHIFNFLFYNDKNDIKVCINNEDCLVEKSPDFKLPDKFIVYVGCVDKLKTWKNPEYSFNGTIYPIILFELSDSSKKDIYDNFKKLLSSMKNKYYLLAEEYFNNHYNNIQFKKDKNKDKTDINLEHLIHNYEIYNGLGEDLINERKIDNLLQKMNNMILYINPYIVVSSFNKKTNKFKDYNIYLTPEPTYYFYEFNIVPSLEQGKLYAYRDNNIVTFFKTNNGLNFIILQIEILFNYILILNSKVEFIEMLKKNPQEFFDKM